MLLPSITHRDDLPEAGMPLRKRARFTTPTGRFEVEESSSAVAARQAGHTLARIIDYGFINTIDASIRDSESRAMTADDRALLGSQAWSHSESRIRALEALVRALQRDVDVLQKQRIRDEDRLMAHIQHEHDMFRDLVRATEAGPQDGPKDVGSSCTNCLRSCRCITKIKANRTSRNGDDNHDSGTGSRRTERAPRECTYSEFLKCQPLNFKGTEGVVNALAWWNSHVKTATHKVACRITWKSLKKMMTNKYYPRGEIKKLEIELWNLKVKGTDMLSYNQHFQELALMCDRMFPKELDEVEKYVGGLPDMIHGSVMASKPKTMQDAIEFAIELMDKKICTLAKRQAENKRKFEDTSRNSQNQQQPFKRHNVARAYTARPKEKKSYGGSKPLCPKCNYHHDGQCAPKVLTCFECGAQGHFKSNFPKLKNKNQGNQARNGNAVAMAYVVGTTGTNPNSNVVMGTFLRNNRYASILFDTSADRSFVSTAFSSLIDIIPTTLDHGHDVELVYGRII
ncbi:putative reverse transcriptase domain-containing protein [Tanacetum coccineum]